MKLFYSILFFIILMIINAEREQVQHGAASAKFRSEHISHGRHNLESDHQAVLGWYLREGEEWQLLALSYTLFPHTLFSGSKKMASEFDELPQDESKRRLAVIAHRMDTNGDNFIDEFELSDWIHRFLFLNLYGGEEIVFLLSFITLLFPVVFKNYS